MKLSYITIMVRDLEQSLRFYQELAALREKAVSLGYEPSEIVDHAPKPRHFTVADPDGITVEFS